MSNVACKRAQPGRQSEMLLQAYIAGCAQDVKGPADGLKHHMLCKLKRALQGSALVTSLPSATLPFSHPGLHIKPSKQTTMRCREVRNHSPRVWKPPGC